MSARLAVILSLSVALFIWAIVSRSREPLPDEIAEAKGKTVLHITSFWGPVNPRRCPRNIDEEADQAVYNAFLDRNQSVALGAGSAIRIEGQAGESALLLSMAGNTAGEILYVNFRSLDQFVRQDFLRPLDDFYVEWFHRESLPPDWGKAADAQFFYGASRAAVKKTPGGWFRRNLHVRRSDSESLPPQEREKAEALLWDPCDPPAPDTLVEPPKVSIADVGRNPLQIGIHPKLWKVIYTRAPDGQRHVYSVPYNMVVMAMVYRKDLFRAAGLDPEKPPRTWDDLYRACGEIADPEQGVYGMGLPRGAWHLIEFIWQSGAEILEEDADGNWRATFDDAKAVRAFKFYRKLLNTYKKAGGKEIAIARNDANMWDDFSRRKCAIRMSYLNEFLVVGSTGITPDVIGVAPLPCGPDGDVGAEFNCAMYGINSQVKDAKRVAAAWRYISFLNSPDARRIKTKIMVDAGYAKYVNPAHLQEFGYDAYLDEVPKVWRSALAAAFEQGKPEPYGRNCQHIYHQLARPLDAILTDGAARAKAAYEPGSPEDLADTAEMERLLKSSVQLTNERLMGRIPPERLKRDRVYAWIAVGAIVLLFVWAGIRIVRTMTSGVRAQDGHVGSRGTRFHVLAWSFMALALISIAVWQYYPLTRGAVMAFQDYRILGGGAWVWLDNFIEMFHNDDFWISILNTLKYVLLALGLGFFIPVILALMLTEVPRCQLIFRTVYYLPAVISGLVTVYLWRWFYDPSPAGLLNTIIGFADSVLGTRIAPVKWLDDKHIAMVCVIVPGIWSGMGAGSIIYIAALKSIPEELYEAADFDGAGPFQKIWHITLPSLRPLLIITLVGAFIGAFHAMQNIFLMTGGGPDMATHVMGLEIWYQAFMYLKFGYATAVAWVMGAMLIGFTIFQLRILKETRFARARGEGRAPGGEA